MEKLQQLYAQVLETFSKQANAWRCANVRDRDRTSHPTSNMADQEGLKYLAVDRRAVHDVVAHSEWAKKKLVWIPHPDLAFVQGSIKSEKGDQVTVELDDGSRKTISKDDVQKMNPPKFEKVEDMAELSFLNEASVMYNLTSRYYSGLIYVSRGHGSGSWARERGEDYRKRYVACFSVMAVYTRVHICTICTFVHFLWVGVRGLGRWILQFCNSKFAL